MGKANNDGTVTIAVRVPLKHYSALTDLVNASPDVKRMSDLMRLIIGDFIARLDEDAQ